MKHGLKINLRTFVIRLVVVNLVIAAYNVTVTNNGPVTTKRQGGEDTQLNILAKGDNLVSDPEVPTGYSLARRVQNQCHQGNYQQEKTRFNIQRLHLINQSHTLYCPIEKVASTFWRRFIYQVSHPGEVQHPFQVSILKGLRQRFVRPKSKSLSQFKDLDFKFMFVREPYHRILSAYIDKVFAPNPYFWNKFGRPAIRLSRESADKRCFHDVTFAEFVSYVVWSDKHDIRVDPHLNKAAEMCAPCGMNYTFIGKMESFKEDAIEIFRRFNLTSAVEVLEKSMKYLADEDAIFDSLSGPYTWKPSILRCMSWKESLQRIWRKLQLRGILSFDEKFPFDNKTSVTTHQFFKLANSARLNSDSETLRLQKKYVFVEMYRTVPLNVLHELRKVFKNDFLLFNYPDTPPEIFDRDSVFHFHNVTNFKE